MTGVGHVKHEDCAELKHWGQLGVPYLSAPDACTNQKVRYQVGQVVSATEILGVFRGPIQVSPERTEQMP